MSWVPVMSWSPLLPYLLLPTAYCLLSPTVAYCRLLIQGRCTQTEAVAVESAAVVRIPVTPVTPVN